MWYLLLFIMLSMMMTNIVIGFCVALLSGHGPRDVTYFVGMEWLESLWEQLRGRFSHLPAISFRKNQTPISEAVAAPSEEKATSSGVIVVDGLPDSFEDVMEQLSMAPIGDMLYDESEEISELAPMQELFDDDLASLLMEQGTEVWLANEKHVETSLLKLNTVMMKSGKFASELDWRIRSARGQITPKEIERFRDEMQDDCLQYLQQQASITQQMQERLDEFGELKSLAEEVDFANMEQSSQIETTVSNLDRMKPTKENAEELAGKLIKELANLRLARHRLRDMQDRTFMDIVFYEKRLDTIPQQLYFDEKFGIRGRIGLEAAIYEWWKQNRNKTRQITFALLDFVKFGDANLEHGIAICDKTIRHFGKLLIDQFDTSDLVGIYNGNCFMVATLNMGPKKTITEVERIRQRCEKTTFLYREGQGSFPLHVTCAITEALATQSQEDVMKALESTLVAAKKAGRNHTYHFVPGPLDKPPELIEAPNLGEEPKEVDLDLIPS